MDIPDAEKDAGKEILYQVTQQAFNELLDILFKAKENLAIRAAETKDARDKHRSLFESINLEEEDKAVSEVASSPEVLPADLDGRRPISSRSLPERHARNRFTIDEVDEEDDEMADLEVVGDTLVEAKEAGAQEPSEYRDPTMPQFRPNSDADTHESASSSASSGPAEPNFYTPPETSPVGPGSLPSSDEKKSNGTAKSRSRRTEKKDTETPTPIPRATLVEWKLLDVAEKEATERHGWGKLSYDELEAIYKNEEQHSIRLDYLGSWIDFCIP